MKVLFIDSVHGILEERLTSNGYSCIDGTQWSYEKCCELLPEMDGIVIRSRFPMDAKFLSNGQRLKFIARSGAGMENIDVTYCEEKGIQLFNAPEGNRNAVGEHALGMLLSLFNHIPSANNDIREGKWEREKNRGIELDGKTVGIIGYGNNGAAFAKKLLGFDVNVLAYDKYKTGFSHANVIEATLDRIYQEADVLSFHIPQNEETLFFANDDFFNHFQKSIYLINLSRGKIVKTASLVNAMKKNIVLGACLDVLEYEKSSFESMFQETLPEDFTYLLESKNVLLTPHVGGWTKESYYKLSDVLATKILAHFGPKL